jgi:outer membrane protein assembly factor BamB
MSARPHRRRASSQRIHSLWLTALIVASLVLVVVGLATSAHHGSDSSRDTATPVRKASAPGGPWLGVRRLKSLPTAIKDASAASVAGGALLLGGVDSSESSVPTIQLVGVSAPKALGSLQTPLHDATAAKLGSKVYLFGGGQSASYDSISAVDPGTGHTQAVGKLPQPRSDLAAATVGHTVYLVGGFTGQTPLASILAYKAPAASHTGQARVAGHMPQPLRYASVAAAGSRVVIAGGISPRGPTSKILVFDPTTHQVSRLGALPEPVSHAPAVAIGRYVYVVGGRAANGAPTRQVFAINSKSGHVSLAAHLPKPLSDAAAVPFAGGILTAGGHSTGGTVRDVFQLSPAPRPENMATTSYLRPGSDPSVLPGNLLIADHENNRLVVVSPQGKIVWSFPRPGDLTHGQTFKVPDDSFFAPGGHRIVATQEDNFVISVVDIGTRKIVYRYGHPGVPGSEPDHLDNPDDAIMLRNGRIISADIKNCRLVELKPPLHHTIAQMGTAGSCGHQPPTLFGSPNGAFPLHNGGNVVTEINGDWVDIFNRAGHLIRAVHPPGFTYPSDTNEVRPGVYLTVDWTAHGAIMKLTGHGRVLWEYKPSGKDSLNHPSLALPLPNGDVVANDDHNHRVIVVDPRTDQIVWQYGHKGVSGRRPGYLNDPDGVDLAPPHSLIDRFPKVTGLPGH